MRYTLLLNYQEGTAETLGREALEEGMRAFEAYARTLEQAGVLVSAEVLAPSTQSRTVSKQHGELRIQDGPLADTKEQLGGTFVLDVPDAETAIHWAAQAPAAEWGVVEVRPGAVHYEDGAWRPNT